MPVMDGFEALTNIQKYLKKLTVTGLVMHDKEDRPEQPELQKHGSGPTHRLPSIFALTADVNPEVSQKCEGVGFKKVFPLLSIENIETIFELAELDMEIFQYCREHPPDDQSSWEIKVENSDDSCSRTENTVSETEEQKEENKYSNMCG